MLGIIFKPFTLQVLCSSTQQEWCYVWDCLVSFDDSRMLDVLHKSVSLLALAEKANRTENTWACILYCYRNFVYIIRVSIILSPTTLCWIKIFIFDYTYDKLCDMLWLYFSVQIFERTSERQPSVQCHRENCWNIKFGNRRHDRRS